MGLVGGAAWSAVAVHGGGMVGEWSDNFDAYELGADIVGLGGWEHWDDEVVSVGARITDDIRQSEPHALVIVGDATGKGVNDSPLQQFAITSGIWDLSVWQFIPDDADFGLVCAIALRMEPAQRNPSSPFAFATFSSGRPNNSIT